MNASLRRFIETLPLITLAVVILGYYNIHSLYGRFHINIYHYLDTSEIILSFASLAYDLTILLVTVIVYLFFSSFRAEPDVEITDKILAERKLRRKLAPFLMAITLGMGTYGIVDDASPLIFIDGTTIAFMSIVLIPIFILDGAYLYEHPILSDIRIYILIPTAFVLFIFYIHVLNGAYHKVLSSGRGKYFVQLTLKDNSQITTNYSFVFVGETRNYFFFYNIKSYTSIIIPTTEVKEIRQRIIGPEFKNIKEFIEGRPEK